MGRFWRDQSQPGAPPLALPQTDLTPHRHSHLHFIKYRGLVTTGAEGAGKAQPHPHHHWHTIINK